MAQSPARRTAPRITVVDGALTTTSRDIAETFGKEHKDVLRRIRDLDCSEEFNRRNFAPVEYVDAHGQAQTEYRITRAGFAFVAMGFTGARAAQWKERYINAFEAMADKRVAQAERRALARSGRARVAKVVPAAPSLLALPHSAPGGDLRTAMLHGLPPAAPLSADVQALVDRRAWVLAHEAYQVAREHVERVVCYQTTPAMREPGHALHARVARAIDAVTLSGALAQRQTEAVAQARDMLRVMVTTLNNSAAEVEREWRHASEAAP